MRTYSNIFLLLFNMILLKKNPTTVDSNHYSQVNIWRGLDFPHHHFIHKYSQFGETNKIQNKKQNKMEFSYVTLYST